jgi:small subunit ribosomal protein S6
MMKESDRGTRTEDASMQDDAGRLRGYEALLILKPGGTEQDVARAASHLEDPIKKLGGSIESGLNLGRRKLAFRISRQTEGYYYLLRFKAPTEQVVELERLFRLNEAIVRFIILNGEEAVPITTLSRPPSPHERRSSMAGARG